MTTLTLSGPTLFAEGRILPATLSITDHKIAALQQGLDPTADIITSGTIAPGLIDLQLNGGYGYDFTDDPASIASVAARLPATGCTGFLPTRITSALESYPGWQRTAEKSSQVTIASGTRNAQVLGFHLEGPFFSPHKVGAHNPVLVRPLAGQSLNVDEVLRYADSSWVRIVTLAPELPGALDVITALRRQGVIVSAGHSNATYDQAQAGFAAGIGWGTHLFNAMSDFKHRDPGLPGALLTSTLSCGIIPDGIHVHPAALKVAWQAKGVTGLCLVTDAMTAMGMPPGEYGLGNGKVMVDATSARLTDGTLAGSIVTMDECLRRMIAFSGCSLTEALLMAARTPADLLGLPHKGRIAAGCDADLVIFDQTLRVTHTIVMGNLAYQR